ncbi:GDSL esterase/lipase [Rhynchospora pubera]|uniref:GDSL esterase/lipase n=1 Tax=Rhynchospora pubera TaxID=906938 RepID=A0AAV8C7V9_9POAL|nr:GDSL esterase/lipase [Rhynchospora pubera]
MNSTRLIICSVLITNIGILLIVNRAHGSQQASALFVFGDSLIDNGNNNYLDSLAKADYYPYGIDFFEGPTGRFCNGKTVIDGMCDLLGLPYLPAHANPNMNGSKLLAGVNYASAAGGILDVTGTFLGDRYSLKQQVLHFEEDLNEIKNLFSHDEDYNEYLSKSIVVMVLGSNDYINNYLVPTLYTSSYTYTPEQYANLLLNEYTRQILAVQSLGIRKFLLAAVGPLGCIPNQRASAGGPDCVDQVNQIVGYFNRGLGSLVKQLNTDHPDSVFLYGNTYDTLGDMLNNPDKYGFTVVDEGCCGLGRNRGQITCLPFAVPCTERSRFVFWDAYHPTEAVNLILAKRAYSGPPSDIYPINLQQLAKL